MIGDENFEGVPDNEEEFPWEDIAASRKNRSLQRRHDPVEAKSRYLQSTPSCPDCGRTPSDLRWFYFKSPTWTWGNLCGQAGWMVVCDGCNKQVAFFLEIMS
jgi:hypothetical protein